MRIPWKLKNLASKIVGRDRVFSPRQYKPDFRWPPKTDSSSQSARLEASGFLIVPQSVADLAANLNEINPLAVETTLKFAEAICEDGLPVYDQKIAPVGASFSWAGLRRGPRNDVLYLVRPHRFSFATVLAHAAMFDERYLVPLGATIENWIKNAGKTRYIWPYISNLVVTQRIVALTWTWHFLSGCTQSPADERQSVMENIQRIILADVVFLKDRLGKSHPNNHLLADFFIGWFIHAVYPDFLGEADFSKYEALFLEEINSQFYDDGGHFEHSSHYQEMCCQMATIYLLLKKVKGQEIAPQCESHISKIMAFNMHLGGPDATMWHLGDATEDSLFLLDMDEKWSTSIIGAIYASQKQGANARMPASDPGFCAAYWLLGGGIGCGETARPETPPLQEFPASGLFLLTDNTISQTTLFRTGVAPGTHFQPGHANSDQLTLYLRQNQREVLAAPGTYSYLYDAVSEQNFRRYFNSRESQSGFVIENNDPSGISETGFRKQDNGTRVATKSSSAAGIATVCEGTMVSETVYNGYRRTVIAMHGLYSIVLDQIPENPNSHPSWIGWQYGPQTSLVIASAGVIKAELEDTESILIPSDNLTDPEIFTGSVEPMRGWVSSHYGQLDAAPYVSYPLDSAATLAAFLLADAAQVSSMQLSVRMLENGVIGITVIGDNFTDYLLYLSNCTSFGGTIDLPEFSGQLLFARRQGKILTALSALGAKHLEWPEFEICIVNGQMPKNIRLHNENGLFGVNTDTLCRF